MMRSIVIDELDATEVLAIKDYLDTHTTPGSLNGIYWLTLDKILWAPPQLKAYPELPPESITFCLSIELGSNQVRFELLVRPECITNMGADLADRAQTLFVLNFIDEMTGSMASGSH